MTPSAVDFSVVVLGAMNPAVHSAAWYRLVDVFGDEELKLAVEDQATFATPEVSQVQTRDFRIFCQPQRWEIHTSRTDMTGRLCEIASRVFDELLKHTPVRAFGFNFDFRFEIGQAPSPKVAAQLRNTKVNIDWNKVLQAEFQLTVDEGDHQVRFCVARSDGETSLQLANNYHFPTIRATPSSSFFEMRPVLEARYGKAREQALERSIDYIDNLVRTARK